MEKYPVVNPGAQPNTLPPRSFLDFTERLDLRARLETGIYLDGR